MVEFVQGIRQRPPRMGGRKLLYKLQIPVAALEIFRGRDAFLDLLRRRDLLAPPKRNRRRTTHAGWWRYPNLIANLNVTKINLVWVGDITYITTEEGFVYLALLTDVFSRFVVGYDISSSLAVEGSFRALEHAVKNTPAENLEGLTHHSDHGIFYVGGAYQERMKEMGIHPSMGEVGNCYENAIAERMNGILKDKYLLDALFVNPEHAYKTTKDSIWLYNYDRPHLSLDMACPADFYFLN